MATGFHGAHVVIGTIFLFVCLMRLLRGHFTPENHVGFEAAAWYWHFVDVVWLFLFCSGLHLGRLSPARTRRLHIRLRNARTQSARGSRALFLFDPTERP